MKTRFTKNLVCLLAATALLTACSSDDKKIPLPGERVSILELQGNLEPTDMTLNAQGFVAPTAWNNEFWPQAGGYPNHAMQHLALNEGPLKQVWTADIGEGASKALPLTAQPVIVDGRVYTLDTNSRVTAFDTKSGKELWNTNVRDKDEDDPVIAGGVAYSRGQLFVTAGYDEVIALSPADGKIKWRARIPSPSRAAPTIMDERLFVTTLDNRILALSTATGQVLWEYTGLSEAAGLIGGASPAASRDIVIPAFSSGELFALRIENGTLAWSENLASSRNVNGLSGISDIRGLPVIDKGLVIAVSFGGRMAAIDERTGDRVWQRDIGSAETPWTAGNHLFLISTNNEVVALGRDNGAISWVKQLPRFKNEEKREGNIFWTGPVLAGGRLILAGSHGDMIELSPEDGAFLRKTTIGKSVTVPLSVADGTLYLQADDGTLMAFR